MVVGGHGNARNCRQSSHRGHRRRSGRQSRTGPAPARLRTAFYSSQSNPIYLYAVIFVCVLGGVLSVPRRVLAVSTRCPSGGVHSVCWRSAGGVRCVSFGTHRHRPAARPASLGHRPAGHLGHRPAPVLRSLGHRPSAQTKKIGFFAWGLLLAIEAAATALRVPGRFGIASPTAYGGLCATIGDSSGRGHGHRRPGRPLGPPPTISAADIRRRRPPPASGGSRDIPVPGACRPDKSCEDLHSKSNKPKRHKRNFSS